MTIARARMKRHSETKLGPSLSAVSEAMARFPVGTLVTFSHDMDQVGVVTGYNLLTEGYYPAGRYPLLVLFGEGEVECSLDMVVRL